MSDFDFQPYRDFLLLDGGKQRALYTPTDALLPLQVGMIAQQGDQTEPERTVEQLPVLEGLQKYALGDQREHVILAGRPGSGKSTALQQLRLALAAEGLVPVLVRLKGDRSIPEMIQGEFRWARQRVSLEQIDDWLFADRLVLLLDGVNEMPTDDLRRGLADFREQNATVPMIFTTRDLAVGDDLGIKQRLEMKPLTELQMRKFVGQRLPVDGEKLLGQLGDQLREIAETPLLLKMLCDVFGQTGQLPESKGELFRLFDREYDKSKVLPPVSEDSRRFKSEILQHLAFVMMTGDLSKPTEFWLTIDKGLAEREIEKFLIDRVSAPAARAKEWLEDLLNHYLLQVATDINSVEFHHQLFQEYYAAEKLLKMLRDNHPDVINGQQFQHFYLNHLRWTEVIAITLSLIDDERQATMIVDLAMSTDLFLGATLIGSMKLDFQKNLIEDLCKKEIADWLKIYLLGCTRSTESTMRLLNFLDSDDLDIAVKSVGALRKINDPQIISKLKARLDRIEKRVEPDAKTNISVAMISISGDKQLSEEAVKLEIEIKKLIAELSPEAIKPMINELISNLTFFTDYFMVRSELNKIIIASAKEEITSIEEELLLKLRESSEINEINHLSSILSDLKSKKASSILVEKSNKSVVISALGYFDDEISSVALVEFLSHSDKYVRYKSTKAMIDSRKLKATPFLVNLLKNQDFYIRFNSARVLAEFNNELSIKVLIEGLNYEEHPVREESAKLLGKMNSIETKYCLTKALKDPIYSVRRNAAISLANSGIKEALPELLNALIYCRDPRLLGFSEEDLAKPENYDVINQWRLENFAYNKKSINTEVINALGNDIFNTKEVHTRLWEVLRQGNKFAATALAKFGITEMVPYLIEILNSDDYEGQPDYQKQLSKIMGLFADLINHAKPSERDSMIFNIIQFLNAPESYNNYYFRHRLAIVLTKVNSEHLICHLSELFTILNTKMGEQVMWVIESIQASCKFYNYDIFRSPPAQVANQPPGTTIYISGDYIIGDKVQGDKVAGDKCDIQNVGNANIQGDQTSEPS